MPDHAQTHRRTLKGQAIAALRPPSVAPQDVRVLLLFNGFTPTETLIGLAERHIDGQARAIVLRLEGQGLIEATKT